MRKFVRDFVVKEWNGLTAKQQEEIEKFALSDSSVMTAYSDDERDLFDTIISDLKREYKNLYDDINLDWSISSQGPYIDRRDWIVDANQSEWEKVDLSDVGIEGDVYVSVIRVVPHGYDFVLPDTFDIELDFDYVDGEVTHNGEDVVYSSFFDVFEHSEHGLDFLNKYADIYSEPLEKYWEICKEYASGFQDIDEWLKFQMTDGFLRAVYFIDDNGNEVFEDFTWE